MQLRTAVGVDVGSLDELLGGLPADRTVYAGADDVRVEVLCDGFVRRGAMYGTLV